MRRAADGECGVGANRASEGQASRQQLFCQVLCYAKHCDTNQPVEEMIKAQSTCGIECLLEFRDSSLRYNPATMNLTSGSRLGPYEIVAPLGAGGMGEVFRARDTRLKREVAIKVLPQATSLDPERLRRLPGELSDGKDGAVENLRRRNGRGCYERCSA